MGKQARKQAIPATELLNFHFSTPVTKDLPSSPQRNFARNNRRQKQQYLRTAQDRASARRKAHSANFYLHSSPNHSFVLTRRSNSKIQGSSAYTFSGCDSPVAWESVRIVQHSISIDPRNPSDEVSCPICLCSFVCPRVTKCGHSFCLPCLLRHFQSYAASNPYAEVRCPCCSLPLLVEDLRPVIMQRTITPITQNVIRLRKLHRQKGCSAPYIPLPDAPKHSSVHTAPCQSDLDAPFSRFNYVDPRLFRSLLEENRQSLMLEMKSTPADCVDHVFLAMGLEMITTQLNAAAEEFEEEIALQRRFGSEQCGMYQKQSPMLIYNPNLLEDQNLFSTDSWPERQVDEIVAHDSRLHHRQRGESFGSYKFAESISSHQSSKSGHDVSRGKSEHHKVEPGAMYLEESEAFHFYQAEGGELVFLSGFNMACLCEDFSKIRPTVDTKVHPPLPDFVSGRILEVQNIHLTPDTQRRMPFLDHLPLYSDISFVELDLSQAMSKEAKKKFQPKLAQRRKKRQSKAQAEKRADHVARREEARLVRERKGRLNLVDPGDEFFHAPVLGESEDDRVRNLVEELEAVDLATSEQPWANVIPMQNAVPTHQSFSEACSRGSNGMRLESEESFPGLRSSFPALQAASTDNAGQDLKLCAVEDSDVPRRSQAPAKHGEKKKATKGQRVVLFSTGGQRGYSY